MWNIHMTWNDQSWCPLPNHSPTNVMPSSVSMWLTSTAYRNCKEHIRLFISSIEHQTMPTVLIWLPEDANTFGHAALRTDKYHISLWPFRGKHLRFSESSITGRFHFHEQLDWVEEGSSENPRRPTSRHAIVNVTNVAINRVYEEFLRYNELDPEEVTLEAARTCIEQNNLHQCVKVLPLTRYSLVGDVIVDKRVERSNFNLLFFIKRCLTPDWSNINICRECIHLAAVNQSTRVTCPFYHMAQSCVSICFNLIEMADPRPLVCLMEARNKTKKTTGYGPVFFLGGDGICREISVPNFDKHVVQKYWKEGCQRVHYDANDFQKGSGFLVILENVLKKVLMIAPTTYFITWLHNVLNYSFLSLLWLTGIIHLVWFVLFHGVLISLLTSGLLPKVVAFIRGFPIFLLLLLNYFLNSTTLFNLGKGGFVFFFFVEFYEINLRLLFDKYIGLLFS